MNVAGLRFPRPRRDQLDRLLADASAADFTYEHTTSTLTRVDLPTWRRDLGDVPGAYERAVAALQSWAPQRRIGARIHPDAAMLEAGTSLLVVLRAGPAEIVAPVRIVAVIDETDRFGYAYGTLPGHPERGEESFIVERTAGGSTRASIVIDAHPATIAARLTAPIVTLLQRRAVRSYLDALA